MSESKSEVVPVVYQGRLDKLTVPIGGGPVVVNAVRGEPVDVSPEVADLLVQTPGWSVFEPEPEPESEPEPEYGYAVRVDEPFQSEEN